MNKLLLSSILILTSIQYSCKNYLDVVPDNVATIDNAFANRNEAEKYLFTCYSYLPMEASVYANPAFLSGDEFWTYYPTNTSISRLPWMPQEIARGNQSKSSPYLNFWDWENGGEGLFRAIRDCNIFLENIDKPVDLEPYEKTRWIGEVQFLKAYYHFYLLRMYGPIPIVDKNIPVNASSEEVRVKREPVDKVADYIANLLDSATAKLPPTILNRTTELGRITKAIALSIKARVLVTFASPLFNGNSDFANFKNTDGTLLFNPTYDQQKWVKAAEACKRAIDYCVDTANCKLYTFSSSLFSLSNELQTEMNIRNSVCEKWNQEIIWGETNGTTTNLQQQAVPRLNASYLNNETTWGQLAPTFKMAELFYSNNGVPITEDKTWDYSNKHQLTTTATVNDYIQDNYQTVKLHFNREPRFYADLAFDGSKWFMQNKPSSWKINARAGQTQARKSGFGYSITGYFPKKLASWKFVINEGQAFSTEDYSWPIIRLADLYLLYAEALNEVNGPSAEAYNSLNLIRARAGLKSVEESWANYSSVPDKYTTKAGLREIIHQERLIELAFEGSRFWDLRRWKEAAGALNQPILGWNIEQSSAEGYYRQILLFNQEFVSPRDYFWPIKDYDIIVNNNLVQNPGW